MSIDLTDQERRVFGKALLASVKVKGTLMSTSTTPPFDPDKPCVTKDDGWPPITAEAWHMALA